ncbi:kinase-like domain-containing protein [Rhizophagus clarus]|uniref:Kinase-like domain-containing protein n=1 Tax=Rhizophagus clarus TaxID=94130 RepID=A0A8H3L5J1_9GLOM|nr:kinase-like domain-containing protein [Rhizophagus clarus]
MNLNIFNNINEVGAGSFGKVYRANWKNSHKCLALKSLHNFNSATSSEIAREIKLHREVDFHNNVIRFYGVTASSQTLQQCTSPLNWPTSNCQKELRNHLIFNQKYLEWLLTLIQEYLIEKEIVTTIKYNGRPPFCNEMYDVGLAMEILQGLKEKPISDTPVDYVKIYTGKHIKLMTYS